VVVNEARRRARVTGTDLLAGFARAAPIDLFGMDALSLRIPGVTGIDDTPQAAMHGEMARRRVYLHPIRWTSLGLALLEAMHLGMPVVALGPRRWPRPSRRGRRGVHGPRPAAASAARARHDPDAAREAGAAARRAALARYGLERF
jgi:glycosyltransferase involved in cell wall biosynthesis